eukprot:5762997-Alexandrium_andersonii.AAC.1
MLACSISVSAARFDRFASSAAIVLTSTPSPKHSAGRASQKLSRGSRRRIRAQGETTGTE